jgi:hypothetical protein
MGGGLELTGADARLLMERAQLRGFAPGEVIRAPGFGPQALLFLQRGSARYEGDGGNGPPVAAPSLFGAMSFLEQAATKLVALERCEIRVIDGAHVLGLIESVPGFGTRFYRMLALQLAKEVRGATGSSLSLPV